MEHQLPPLPYPIDALAPNYSQEAFEYHHGKHHMSKKMKMDKMDAPAGDAAPAADAPK